MAWYNTNWSNRIAITIDSGEVDADLTDFPVYVDLDDLPASFFSTVKSDGSDIRVTKDDGTTELPVEIVTIDTGSTTGELYFKYTGTLSSSSDTDVYIYYGHSGASAYAEDATYGRENVWEGNYGSVYHMAQDPSGSAPQLIDSTSNDRNGTSNGSMTTGDLVDSKIGKGIDFDGSNDFFSVGSFGHSTGASITVELWLKPAVTGGNRYMVDESNSGSIGGGLAFRVKSGGGLRFWSESAGSALDSSSTLSAGTRYHLVAVYDGSKNYIYINGVEDANNTVGAVSGRNAANPRIGHSSLLGGYTSAEMDELRISNTGRSADWIAASYSNQNTPGSFYSVGSEEDAPIGGSEQPAIFFGCNF